MNDESAVRPDRVIIYGATPERWRMALAPQGGVWDGVPGVREVVAADRLGELLRLGRIGARPAIVLPMLKKALHRFPRLWWNLAPTREAHDTCADKWRFARFMHASGMGDMVPRSWRRREDCRFPCVVKRLNKDGSFGVKIVGSKAELDATLTAPPFRHRPTLFQEAIEGLVDHATHCVAVEGRMVWHTSYAYDIDPNTRVQTIEAHEGRRRFDVPTQVREQFEQVLGALGYSGPASFDWRPRGAGAVLFEINPRFGGSMMLPINRDDLRAGLTALVQHARPPTWLQRRG